MARCPVCESAYIVVVSPRRLVRCSRCGTRWIQEGRDQRAVHRLDSSPLNISAVSVHPPPPVNVISRRRAT